MPSTLRQPEPSTTVPSLDNVRTKNAKATLRSPSPSIAGCAVVKDALIRHYGSLKAAAITLGKDPSQLSRDLTNGDFKLRELDKDDEAKAFIVGALFEAFGVVDHRTHVQRLLREGRRILDELAEVVNG